MMIDEIISSVGFFIIALCFLILWILEIRKRRKVEKIAQEVVEAYDELWEMIEHE